MAVAKVVVDRALQLDGKLVGGSKPVNGDVGVRPDREVEQQDTVAAIDLKECVAVGTWSGAGI